jgi:opacity protein-like surface antigen
MRSIVLAAMTALAAAVAPAMAQPLEPGQFAGALSLGADFPVGGDVHGGATAPVADLGPLNPALAGVSAELRIQARSFDDIYGEAASYGLEGAYGLSGDREIFGSITRVEADESRVQVGGAFVPALSQTLPVFGTFGEYNATRIEAGVRQYFGADGFRPYVAGRVGVAVTDEIRASFAIPDANILISNVAFYDESTVLALGADAGVSYALSDRFTVGAEVGVRYSAGLEDNDSAIAGLGLSRINDEGDRWSIPVTVRARLAF